MHAEPIIITVRYSSGTYVARARGSRHTASCTHSQVFAARQLARKLDLDVLGMKRGSDRDGVATFEAWPLKTGPIAEIYGELWRKASSMGYESVTEALAELEALREKLRRIECIAECRSVQNWLALPDEDKASWFGLHLEREAERLELRALLAGGDA